MASEVFMFKAFVLSLFSFCLSITMNCQAESSHVPVNGVYVSSVKSDNNQDVNSSAEDNIRNDNKRRPNVRQGGNRGSFQDNSRPGGMDNGKRPNHSGQSNGLPNGNRYGDRVYPGDKMRQNNQQNFDRTQVRKDDGQKRMTKEEWEEWQRRERRRKANQK